MRATTQVVEAGDAAHHFATDNTDVVVRVLFHHHRP
jgi:hypothetical protein